MSVAKRIVQVLYHCPCPDGAFAGLAAFLRFRAAPSVDVNFVPHAVYKELDFSQFPSESEVYLLDYVGTGESWLTRLSQQVKKITLIDHHKTAFELIGSMRERQALPANLDVHLEMERSGATMAYAHFVAQQPLVDDAEKRKSLETVYSYIEDNDLWRKALANTKEFSCGLAAYNIEYDYTKNPNVFTQLLDLDAEKVIERGRQQIAEDQANIESEIAASFVVQLGGKDAESAEFGRCLGVHTKFPDLRSEMGHQLAMKSERAGLRGIGVVVYEEANMADQSKLKVSLRSVRDEDTTRISKHYGGGGHLNASSFLLARSIFDSAWRHLESSVEQVAVGEEQASKRSRLDDAEKAV